MNTSQCDIMPFGTKSEALHCASVFEKKPKRKGGDSRPYKLKAYRCEDCSQWHLRKRVRGSYG